MRKYAWLCCLLLCGCSWDNMEDQATAYPADVAAILPSNCATSGCHTAQSAEAASGLNLETWDGLFKGSRGGSAVIPYAPEMSYLLYSVNTDPGRGITLSPTMPLNRAHLTDAQYETLKQWIAEGAPNSDGELRFPDISSRRKWYVTNQGCDLVAVFDAESRQIMRYVTVGTSTSSESPHNVKISKDGQYWYVIFYTGNPHIEVYSTLTDQKVTEILIGSGSWNTFTISPGGKFAVAVSYIQSGQGTIDAAIVDLEQNTLVEGFTVGTKVHGSTAHPTLSRFYLTKQDESGLIVVDYDHLTGHVDNIDDIDLLQGIAAHAGDGVLRPHEMIFSPDGSKYFVSCQGAREVRVYESTNNTLQDVIDVGDEPVECVISAPTGHLFVSCMEDVTTFPNKPNQHGSVAIIDINSNSLVKSIYTGYQPHGIAIDEVSGCAVVTNRNVSVTGPAPHHSSVCGSRNGYLTAIDLHTLELVPNFKPELSNDPYSVAVKH